MGTRSLTIILDGNSEVCRIYRQYDGYPKGHGVELAEACAGRVMVNGFSDKKKQANGMGCLAALIVSALKGDDAGGIYLHPTGGEIGEWVEYVYTLRLIGETIQLQCTTQTGPWPFNVQAKEKHVFTGTPAQWIKKFKQKAA